MPEALISTALATGWIKKLAKELAKISGERRKEIIKLADEFGNPELLAERYIEPFCQVHNPADLDEDEAQRALQSPISAWLANFLDGEFRKKDGRHVVFFLSDAGMGKTSLLTMLKLTHLLRFWPKKLKCELLKLGDGTLERIGKMEDRSRTVLLLDALDEDSKGWDRIADRLKELLQATENFRQVLITCRTQFFPTGNESQILGKGKVEVEGYNCNLLFISQFSDAQAEEYLQKIYSSTLAAKFVKMVRGDSKQLKKARNLVSAMKSLKMRPLLLSYIEDLMGEELENTGEYFVYERLVGEWLGREERKKLKGKRPTRKQLWEACESLAVQLQKSGKRELSPDELARMLPINKEALSAIDVGGRSLLNRTSAGAYRFAHYSIQEFLVAHWIVTLYGYSQHIIDQLAPSPKSVRITEQIEAFIAAALGRLPKYQLVSLIRFLTERGHRIRLAGINLEGANLEGANLLRADLQGANLGGADLQGANLEGANLSKAWLQDASLWNANLEGASLLRANLQRANLRSAKLLRARFLGADLQDASLWSADLQGANLESANLENANLQEANLHNAKLSNADLQGANLWSADLRGASLQRANLTAAKLQSAKLSNADLQGANLWRADLRSANLQRARLHSARLQGADLHLASLKDAKGIQLRNTKGTPKEMP